jgi:hypothetical protein
MTGDRHYDNPHSNWSFQEEHLKKAKERNAPIIDVGDFFCAMQGKYDKRKELSNIRPEHVVNDYLDAILRTAEERLGKYAKQFAVIGYGNHETSILNHTSTDLIQRLVDKFREKHGAQNCYAGGYGGWVRFMFRPRKNHRESKLLKYHHGHGGGAPVTRGVIQTNRRAVFLPDANVVLSGHIHNSWVVPIQRERINQRGNIYQDTAYHVCVPGYKNEYRDGADGHAVQRGWSPHPIGAAWLRFYARKDKVKMTVVEDLL